MPNLSKRITLFLSSPGDLTDQRDLIKKVCDDLSHDLGRVENFYIELIRWETHSFSAIGDSPQTVINEQVGDNYDIFLGMLGNRFGTQTKLYSSGTEEEFFRAVDRLKKTGAPEIMFFFFDGKVSLGSIDATQLAKVQAFKSTLSDIGVLYFNFEDALSLYRIAYRQIHETVQKVLIKSDAPQSRDLYAEVASTFDPLGEWNRLLTNDTEIYASVLMQRAAQSMRSVNSRIVRLTKANGSLIKTLAQEAKNLARADIVRQQDKAFRSLQKIITGMQEVNNEHLDILPGLYDDLISTMTLSQRSIAMFEARGELGTEIRETAFKSLSSLTTSLEIVRKTLESIRAKLGIDYLPGSALSVEQRKLSSLFKDLSGILDAGIREGRVLESMLQDKQA